jgi:hypothetical protein
MPPSTGIFEALAERRRYSGCQYQVGGVFEQRFDDNRHRRPTRRICSPAVLSAPGGAENLNRIPDAGRCAGYADGANLASGRGRSNPVSAS